VTLQDKRKESKEACFAFQTFEGEVKGKKKRGWSRDGFLYKSKAAIQDALRRGGMKKRKTL